MIGPSYPPDEPPLGQGAVNSAFELAWNARIGLGRRHVLTGRSWSGGGPINRVEISVDDGASWDAAELTSPGQPYSWARWRYPWTPTRCGAHGLRARATDAAGRTQPDANPYNTGGNGFNAVAAHPVTVAPD